MATKDKVKTMPGSTDKSSSDYAKPMASQKKYSETFGEAFSKAKKAGKKTFSFKGKKYTTRTKDEDRKDQKIGSSKNTSAGRGRGTVDTGSLRSKRIESKLSSKKNTSAGRGRGTVDTGSLRSKRIESKLGSGKNVRGTKGEGGTKETGKLFTKRSGRIGEKGKNVRNTKGKGGTKDFRSTMQKVKDFDFKDAFGDIKKKLGFYDGGSVGKGDGMAIRGKSKGTMR